MQDPQTGEFAKLVVPHLATPFRVTWRLTRKDLLRKW